MDMMTFLLAGREEQAKDGTSHCVTNEVTHKQTDDKESQGKVNMTKYRTVGTYRAMSLTRYLPV